MSDEPLRRSDSQSDVVHIENGEQVYPCRCGETHRGPHALYTYGHHNCFHDEPLIAPMAEARMLLCPQCGKDFEVDLDR